MKWIIFTQETVIEEGLLILVLTTAGPLPLLGCFRDLGGYGAKQDVYFVKEGGGNMGIFKPEDITHYSPLKTKDGQDFLITTPKHVSMYKMK